MNSDVYKISIALGGLVEEAGGVAAAVHILTERTAALEVPTVCCAATYQ